MYEIQCSAEFVFWVTLKKILNKKINFVEIPGWSCTTLHRAAGTLVRTLHFGLWVCAFVAICVLLQCTCALLYFHLGSVLLYHFLPHYLIMGMIFAGGGELLNKKRVLIFAINLSEQFPILRKTERDIITMVPRSSRKVPVIIVRF